MDVTFTEDFQKLITKFLFLNCKDGKNKNQESELNIVLNELNSLDYERGKLFDPKAALRLIESFSNISANQETLIVKACCLATVLINKQKIQFNVNEFKNTMDWLTKCLQFNLYGATEILSTMHTMFKNNSQHCFRYWDALLSTDGLLLRLMNESNIPKKNIKKNDSNSFEEILASTVICIEALILGPTEIEDKELELLGFVGNKIIQIIYGNHIKITNFTHGLVSLTAALNVLIKIASEDNDWCDNHLGELLGIAKAYIHYGLPIKSENIPQKVLASQQSIFVESPGHVETQKGGKIIKTRKPRTSNKNKKNDSKLKNKGAGGSSRDDERLPTLAFDIDNTYLSGLYKTSDSDFSESEASRAQNDKYKKAKLRLAAISLIGAITKNCDKKIFYGYWHSLFSHQDNTGLLKTIIQDSNNRCRLQALQVTTVILYGSKVFLFQAENTTEPPTSFMPFSISLGNMIITIYEILTQALSTENSVPVLTHILKCLAVLIQATPFTRLKSGFVTNFMKYIRKLVYHKDPTIQVAALMAMEFLISSQEFTVEISDCVGIPKSECTGINRNENKLNDSGVEEIIEIEHYEDIEFESDSEQLESTADNENDEVEKPTIPSILKMSWLLQKVLENLGVVVGNIKQKLVASSNPVRLESLHVLIAMSSHFKMIKSHLQAIGAALKIALEDDQPEIRLNCAKTLDAFGHAINTFLLENPQNDEILLCQSFWTAIMPHVIKKVQDPTQNVIFRGVLCDFMSNIGVHIFERLPHSHQMQLVSLLTGISCNDENTVRASAVRALAVFAFFPSLRADLCFVENTAESIIKLMTDKNSFVRIKSSWSLGNVSDALIANCLDSDLDRISDDLLKRLLDVTIESLNDNDKVKCNAVRTIGNLLRLITTEQLKLCAWCSLCFLAIEKLVKCMNICGNAKVKWNSCYAIGNFMKNTALFTASQEFDWQKLVFPSVCSIIINSTHFKVRINGAAALIVINDRKLYGNQYIEIWSSFLAAMVQSDNLTDFNEYKHRDNLQEQLCFCISHFVKLASKEDLILLKNALINTEIIQQIWMRVTNRIIPENAAPLINCWIHLKQLLETNDCLNVEQKNAVQGIVDCFSSPVEKWL